ncbi:N-acetylmuramoyl-L-alanine amidase [Paenibacillus sp. N1-5-1-14]|uniref:peptidoglycan recognition protein family protein n=1 Tax=Paenibacillus radicibacter TaxID=2972488 RepID=UPI002158B005|nr:N-acetylmuramoyl-L-alanine amidase [Paenibacillus radicibacter]MCR8645594.1 N-acetylmuramoyl-L-alanine amidase [Paenibacillus radicibacter]
MVKYLQDHIPKNTQFNRRTSYEMHPTYLTIHNTGNSTSSARNERNWLTNPFNKRTASFHIIIDENEAIECIPLNEVAWHAGDGNGDGNRRSIGIEICESGNYEQTLENAVQLVASMLRKRGWGVDRLRRHYDWSGKICPRLMYDSGKWTGWHKFVAAVDTQLKEVNDILQFEHDYQWKQLGDALDGLYRVGEINDYTWAEKAYTRKLTQSELAWINTILYARGKGIAV